MGRPDLLILTHDAVYPVDFKDTEGGVPRNHRVQIAAYAMLSEERFARPAPNGFIYLTPTRELARVELGERERAYVLQALEQMRATVAEQRTPPPTSVRARCVGCDYRNYCGDVD